MGTRKSWPIGPAPPTERTAAETTARSSGSQSDCTSSCKEEKSKVNHVTTLDQFLLMTPPFKSNDLKRIAKFDSCSFRRSSCDSKVHLSLLLPLIA
jgi:hypothetical protein